LGIKKPAEYGGQKGFLYLHLVVTSIPTLFKSGAPIALFPGLGGKFSANLWCVRYCQYDSAQSDEESCDSEWDCLAYKASEKKDKSKANESETKKCSFFLRCTRVSRKSRYESRIIRAKCALHLGKELFFSIR
jgi:hypothetical protein